MTDVLVFVPGLMGSELWLGNDKVWPGSGWDAVAGFSQKEFERLMREDLEPRAILRKAVGGFLEIYEEWIARFERLRSIEDNRRLFQEQEGTLVTVPYDWRKPIAGAADLLANALDKVVIEKGQAVKILLVAHSMGGLVSRYYLQSGNFKERPAFKQVKTFVTLGTPHNGAPIALAGVVGKHKTSFLSVEQSMRLSGDVRYPSLYQTFPDKDYPLVWERTSGGKLMPRTLGDRNFAIDTLGLNAQNYEAYRQFRDAIDGPYPPLRRFVLMGTRYETMTHFFWTGGKTLQPVMSKDGGDGTVSIQGAYLGDAQCRFTGEAHVTLVNAEEARQTFQELVGATGMLATPQVQVSVRDLVVDQGAPVQISIITDGRLDRLSGEVVLVGAPLPANTSAEPTNVEFRPLRGRAPQPFSYDGPRIAGANLILSGVPTPGLYRVLLRSTSSVEPIAESATFVVTGTSPVQ